MLNPKRSIMLNTPIRETGMVIKGIRVARKFRKNKNMTTTTKATASKMVVKTESIEREINTEES